MSRKPLNIGEVFAGLMPEEQVEAVRAGVASQVSRRNAPDLFATLTATALVVALKTVRPVLPVTRADAEAFLASLNDAEEQTETAPEPPEVTVVELGKKAVAKAEKPKPVAVVMFITVAVICREVEQAAQELGTAFVPLSAFYDRPELADFPSDRKMRESAVRKAERRGSVEVAEGEDGLIIHRITSRSGSADRRTKDAAEAYVEAIVVDVQKPCTIPQDKLERACVREIGMMSGKVRRPISVDDFLFGASRLDLPADPVLRAQVLAVCQNRGMVVHEGKTIITAALRDKLAEEWAAEVEARRHAEAKAKPEAAPKPVVPAPQVAAPNDSDKGKKPAETAKKPELIAPKPRAPRTDAVEIPMPMFLAQLALAEAHFGKNPGGFVGRGYFIGSWRIKDDSVSWGRAADREAALKRAIGDGLVEEYTVGEGEDAKQAIRLTEAGNDQLKPKNGASSKPATKKVEEPPPEPPENISELTQDQRETLALLYGRFEESGGDPIMMSGFSRKQRADIKGLAKLGLVQPDGTDVKSMMLRRTGPGAMLAKQLPVAAEAVEAAPQSGGESALA